MCLTHSGARIRPNEPNLVCFFFFASGLCLQPTQGLASLYPRVFEGGTVDRKIRRLVPRQCFPIWLGLALLDQALRWESASTFGWQLPSLWLILQGVVRKEAALAKQGWARLCPAKASTATAKVQMFDTAVCF